MRNFIAFLFLATSSMPAVAEGICDHGKPEMLGFLSWEFKDNQDKYKSVDVTINYHNNVDQSFELMGVFYFVNDANGKRVTEGSFGSSAKANSDATESMTSVFDPPEQWHEVMNLKPTLCVYYTIDENKVRVDY